MASQETPPQTLSDAAVRLRNASKMRYVMLRDQAGVVWGQARTRAPTYWEDYKPRTLLQWTGFCGLVLLAISGLSTIVNIMGALTLGMAWLGLVVYFVTVSSSTVAGFFCGSAMMMFSATTAIMGTSILAGVASVYALMAAYTRAKGYASPYLDAVQQRRAQQQLAPTAQMRYPPQSSPARLSAAGTDASATTGTPSNSTAQLLGDVTPGRPQVSEVISPTSAPANSYSSDAAPKAQSSNHTKSSMKAASTAQHGTVGANGVSYRVSAAMSSA